MSVSNVAEVFRPVSELDWFEKLQLPTLTDEQHLKRAIDSGRPHSYIAERAGMLSFEDGFRGLGMVNAESLHLRLMKNAEIEPSQADITEAQATISFTVAVSAMKGNLPASYKDAMCPKSLALATQSNNSEFNLR